VPAKDRLRRDEERLPAFPRDETGKQSDERAVGPGEAGTGDLAAKHGQLVAEHEDLCIFRRGIGPVDTKNLEDASEQTVDKGQGHGGRAWPVASCLVKPDRQVSGPFRSCTMRPAKSVSTPASSGAALPLVGLATR